MPTWCSVKRWFEALASSNKTVEARLRSKLKDLQIGDTITFKCGSRSCVQRVNFIHMYFNFKELLCEEGLENVLPGEEGVE